MAKPHIIMEGGSEGSQRKRKWTEKKIFPSYFLFLHTFFCVCLGIHPWCSHDLPRSDDHASKTLWTVKHKATQRRNMVDGWKEINIKLHETCLAHSPLKQYNPQPIRFSYFSEKTDQASSSKICLTYIFLRYNLYTRLSSLWFYFQYFFWNSKWSWGSHHRTPQVFINSVMINRECVWTVCGAQCLNFYPLALQKKKVLRFFSLNVNPTIQHTLSTCTHVNIFLSFGSRGEIYF